MCGKVIELNMRRANAIRDIAAITGCSLVEVMPLLEAMEARIGEKAKEIPIREDPRTRGKVVTLPLPPRR